jgi:hypothetical protein
LQNKDQIIRLQNRLEQLLTYVTQREAVHSREERSMNERIKSLEGRVRRVQTFLKTTPIVIQKVSSSKATSSVNTSIHNDDQGNNSSLPSDARASN